MEAIPHIGVLFEIRNAETRPGELVGLVGSRPELSNWDPFDFKVARGLQLRTGAKHYPSWSMFGPVWIQIGADGSSPWKENDAWSDPETDSDAGSPPISPLPVARDNRLAMANELPPVRLEYKYVKDRRQLRDCGPSVQWEDSIANRKVTIPQEHGSIWIVTDQKFNEAGEARITRTTLAEILQRCDDLDPEWTMYQPRYDWSAPEWAGSCEERPDGSLDRELSSSGSVETSSSQYSAHSTSTIMLF